MIKSFIGILLIKKYACSESGEILNLNNNEILKTMKTIDGLKTFLFNGEFFELRNVHEVVFESLYNCLKHGRICHLDDNPYNNNIENLANLQMLISL